MSLCWPGRSDEVTDRFAHPMHPNSLLDFPLLSVALLFLAGCSDSDIAFIDNYSKNCRDKEDCIISAEELWGVRADSTRWIVGPTYFSAEELQDFKARWPHSPEIEVPAIPEGDAGLVYILSDSNLIYIKSYSEEFMSQIQFNWLRSCKEGNIGYRIIDAHDPEAELESFRYHLQEICL